MNENAADESKFRGGSVTNWKECGMEMMCSISRQRCYSFLFDTSVTLRKFSNDERGVPEGVDIEDMFIAHLNVSCDLDIIDANINRIFWIKYVAQIMQIIVDKVLLYVNYFKVISKEIPK